MMFIKRNWPKILLVVVLLLGMGVSVYLIRQPQIFQSSAQSEINAGLNVTSPDGAVLYSGNNSYTTNSRNIKVSVKNLEELIRP